MNDKVKLLVCRRDVEKRPPPAELAIKDFCWAAEGDVLAPPGLVCACPDCGCAGALDGVNSRRGTTWGVVEERTRAQVEEVLQRSDWILDWERSLGEEAAAEARELIQDLWARLLTLPVGAVVGCWTSSSGAFLIYDRSVPVRVR